MSLAAVCTTMGLPVAWQVETARQSESPLVPTLLDKLTDNGFAVGTAVLDKGYDVNPVYEACEAHGHSPDHSASQDTVLRRRTASPVPTPSAGHRSGVARLGECQYRQRGSVEHEFGALKHQWAMLPLRVRLLPKVRLHVDLTILTRLATALDKARSTHGAPALVAA